MTEKYDYISEVQEAANRAKILLGSPSNTNIRYAALELRMCIEGIAYDDLQTYPKGSMPDEAYTAWQANQVATHILTVDPTYFDRGVLILAPKGQIIDEDGKINKENIKRINTDFPEGWSKLTQGSFKKRITKNLYHALGRIFHVDTLRQKEKGVDFGKHLKICSEVLSAVEERLDANVGTIALWHSLSHDCQECNTKNVFSYLQTISEKAQLFRCCNTGCPAEYAVSLSSPQEYSIGPYGRVCQCHGCGEKYLVWRRLFLVGSNAPCPACGKQHKVGIGNMPVPDEA